jgi:MFS family permease
MTVITVSSFFGFVGSAYLSDVVGRRGNFLIFCISSWLLTLAYMYLPLDNTAILLLSAPFGFFTIGAYSSLGPFFTELFPTSIRGSGQSFAYNFGKGAGALCVAAVGLLAETIPLGEAIGVVSLAGYMLAMIAALLLPETRGLKLTPTGIADPMVAASTIAPSAGTDAAYKV